MTPRRIAILCFLSLSAALYAIPLLGQEPPGRGSGGRVAGTTPEPKRPTMIIGTVPDTGQFLPDTAVLGSMNERVLRVRDFVETYYSSYAEFRPRPDSAGRVEFLNTMINKEVLAYACRLAQRPESFEDRMVMGEHVQRVLSNVLFQRAVLDSVRDPSEEEIRRIYAQLGYQLRLQKIVVRERVRAERLRRDLVERRITWRDAVNRYSTLSVDSFPDGQLGWQNRASVDPEIATTVFDLENGAISPALPDWGGYAIYRAGERRSIPALSYPPMRSMIRDEVRSLQIAERGGRIMAALRAKAGMTHDSANIAWAASHFAPAVTTTGGPRPMIDIDAGLPHFEPGDTSRVLGRWTDGQLTLGGFLAAYGAMSPIVRPTVTTAEAFASQVDRFALEPYRADLARDRGLDQDSLTIALIEKRREELMVEHFYQDSILANVQVSSADRRKYYQEHLMSFVTFPAVSYARFHIDRRSEADSLAARLRAGEQAAAILRNSRRGAEWGAIEERRHNEEGTPYYKLLFEELRPGQVAIEGPDSRGHFEVIQLLSFDPGRQLSYEEAETHVAESLRNLAAERALKALIERYRRQVRIVTRPELVMDIRLIDPAMR